MVPHCAQQSISSLVVSDSVRPHGLYVARQAPLSMGFSRQEYWSGLPFPSPGDLANTGIEPRSPALQADSLPTEPPGHIIGLNKYLGTFKTVLCIVGPEEDQNIPPQNTPLWHKNYFKLKLIEKKQTQELLCPLLFCLKAGHKFSLLKVTEFLCKDKINFPLWRCPQPPLPCQNKETTLITGNGPNLSLHNRALPNKLYLP